MPSVWPFGQVAVATCLEIWCRKFIESQLKARAALLGITLSHILLLRIRPNGAIQQAVALVAAFLVCGQAPADDTACQACVPRYWIVSTRSCPEPNPCSIETCPPDVFDMDGTPGGRPSSLEELLVSLPPGIPVCIMSHGSFVDWQIACDDSLGTARWLASACGGQQVAMIFFTWPSEGRSPLLVQFDVAVLGKRATRHGKYMADLVSAISPDHPVCLIGHSHGARVMVSALQLLGGGSSEGVTLAQPLPAPCRLRVVLAAAAIDHHWLNEGERFGNALCRVEALLNLQNRKDLVLSVYPLRRPFAKAALARKGFTDRDRAKMGWQGPKVTDVDVTDIIRYHHTWPNYYRSAAIRDLVAPYITFAESYADVPAASGPLIQQEWQLPPPLPEHSPSLGLEPQLAPAAPIPARPIQFSAGSSIPPAPVP